MIPPWLETFAADLVDHIELGLEGDWSATVRTVWSRDQAFLGFDGPATEHTDFRPAPELYLADGWIGVHRFRFEDGRYVLDRAKAEALIEHVRSGGG